MKNPLLKKAIKIANAISKEYNLLTIENNNFFNQYHDDLMIQRDCAWQVVNDIEYYEEKNEIKNALLDIKNLEKTLIYCKAVIALQKQTNKLPESIYG